MRGMYVKITKIYFLRATCAIRVVASLLNSIGRVEGNDVEGSDFLPDLGCYINIFVHELKGKQRKPADVMADLRDCTDMTHESQQLDHDDLCETLTCSR
jgi:hypothetical protein